MYGENINIPLAESPARTTARRAFRLFGITGALLVFGIVLFRLVSAQDVLLPFVPNDATITLSVIKTGATLNAARNHAAMIPAAPGLPLSIFDVLSGAKNRAIFYSVGTNGGFLLDTEPSEEMTRAASVSGYTILNPNDDGVYLVIKSDKTGGYQAAGRRERLLTTINPFVSGTLTLGKLDENDSIPFSVGKDKVVFSVDMGSSLLYANPAPSVSNSFINISIAKEAFVAIDPLVSLTTPGIAMIKDEILVHGASLSVGSDDSGVLFALEIPNATISVDKLSIVAKEMYSIRHLSTLASTNALSNGTFEIRTTTPPTMSVQKTGDIGLISAVGESGGIFITQTAESTTITNKQVGIEEKTARVDTCMRDPWGFFYPKNVAEFLPEMGEGTSSLAAFLSQANEIALGNGKITLCW